MHSLSFSFSRLLFLSFQKFCLILFHICLFFWNLIFLKCSLLSLKLLSIFSMPSKIFFSVIWSSKSLILLCVMLLWLSCMVDCILNYLRYNTDTVLMYDAFILRWWTLKYLWVKCCHTCNLLEVVQYERKDTWVIHELTERWSKCGEKDRQILNLHDKWMVIHFISTPVYAWKFCTS